MDDQLARQEAFLLGRLMDAPAIPIALSKLATAAALKSAGLDKTSAIELLARLATAGQVEEIRTGKGKRINIAYCSTGAGAARYRELLRRPPHDKPQLLGYQKAFLLLQLLLAGEAGLTPAKVKSKLTTGVAKKSLAPDAKTVEWLQASIMSEGTAEKTGTGAKATYRLTPAGEAALATADQYPSLEFKLRGRDLSALLAAGRAALEGERSHAASATEDAAVISPAEPAAASTQDYALPSHEPDIETAVVSGDAIWGETPPPTDRVGSGAPPSEPISLTDLSDALLGEVEALRREQFADTGLVPIYELRSRLSGKYGAGAASHVVLDPLLMRLRLAARVRLVAIGDRRDATPEQLRDAIPGEGETFFYIETRLDE